jgi:hypothetical protein
VKKQLRNESAQAIVSKALNFNASFACRTLDFSNSKGVGSYFSLSGNFLSAAHFLS